MTIKEEIDRGPLGLKSESDNPTTSYNEEAHGGETTMFLSFGIMAFGLL